MGDMDKKRWLQLRTYFRTGSSINGTAVLEGVPSMRNFFTFCLMLVLCGACEAKDPLRVKDLLLGVDRYVGRDFLLTACFKGSRDGAHLVDCGDESFAMAFEVSDEFKRDEVMTKDFYRCVYRASSPKPEKSVFVVLKGSIKKGEQPGYPPYFLADGVHRLCN
jgi:hypothetical protein